MERKGSGTSVNLPGLSWPEEAHVALRRAAGGRDGAAVAALVKRHGLDGPLQAIGEAVLLPGVGRDLAARVAAALRVRDGVGDRLVAAEIDSFLGVGPVPSGRPVPVDLEDLAMAMAGWGPEGEARLDPGTGTIHYPLGEFGDREEEEEEDPGRERLFIEVDSRPSWKDMELFADAVTDAALRDHLLGVIRGKGAFGRFKAAVGTRADLLRAWYQFKNEREEGRAREWLRGNGLRPVPGPPGA